MDQIVVGDWLVAGPDGSDGLDIGCIVAIDGDIALVAWRSGTQTSVDVTDDDVEVFGSLVDAEARYERRRATGDGYSTLDDLTRAVADRFGMWDDWQSLRDPVDDAVPGRYEQVRIDDRFLRDVWENAYPDIEYPF